MCRLRRAKLEVVVPAAQGERYKPAEPVIATEPDDLELDSEDTEETEEDKNPVAVRKPKLNGLKKFRPTASISASDSVANPLAHSTRPTRSCASRARNPRPACPARQSGG